MRKKIQKNQAAENKLHSLLQTHCTTIATAMENKSFEFDYNEIARKLKDISKLKSTDPIFKAIDKRGENLIHAMIRAPKHLKLGQHIPALAKLGANLNYKNTKDFSPLFLVVQLGDEEALKNLYEAGVDLTATALDGDNILDYALGRASETNNSSILKLILSFLKQKKIALIAGSYLIELAEAGLLSRLKEIEKLGAQRKVEINIDKLHPFNSRTALIAAAREKHSEVVRYLLEQKANSFLQDCEGLNVLMHAVLQKDEKTLDIILEKKSQEEKLQLISPLGNKINALDLAVQKDIKLVIKLLEHKADINHQDHNGHTALHKAIYLNETSIIDLLITNPLLDINKFSFPLLCLHLAIEKCSVLVLNKLLEISAFRCKINDESGFEFYKLAINLNKNTHCISLIRHRVNLNFNQLTGYHPLSLFCMFEKTDLIKALFKFGWEHTSVYSILYSLDYLIRKEKQKIVILLLQLIGDFPQFVRGRGLSFENEYLDYYAKCCIVKKWPNLALEFQPKLKLLINFKPFKEIFPLHLVQMIGYLQGRPPVSFLYVFLDNSAAPSEPVFLSFEQTLPEKSFSSGSSMEGKKYILAPDDQFGSKEFDFSDIANSIPWLRDYAPDADNPDRWLKFLETPPPTVSLPVIPATQKLTPAAVKPYTFFVRQGYSPEEARRIVREAKTQTLTESRCSIFKSEMEQSGCSWLDGQITSQDSRVRLVEGSTIRNTFLFISETLEKQILAKRRFHFHPKDGLKSLNRSKPLKTEVNLEFKNSELVYITQFTHEITDPTSKDRILCVRVDADPQQRGVLYIAAYYLKDGLHHRKPKLPDKVTLNMSPPDPGQSLKFS